MLYDPETGAVDALLTIKPICCCCQAEALPAVGQTTPESDSDSGMGSPAEETVPDNRDADPGNIKVAGTVWSNDLLGHEESARSKPRLETPTGNNLGIRCRTEQSFIGCEISKVSGNTNIKTRMWKGTNKKPII